MLWDSPGGRHNCLTVCWGRAPPRRLCSLNCSRQQLGLSHNLEKNHEKFSRERGFDDKGRFLWQIMLLLRVPRKNILLWTMLNFYPKYGYAYDMFSPLRGVHCRCPLMHEVQPSSSGRYTGQSCHVWRQRRVSPQATFPIRGLAILLPAEFDTCCPRW